MSAGARLTKWSSSKPVERKGSGGAVGYVDHEGGATPAPVLLNFDVDGGPADLTELDVVLAREQLSPGQAPRRGPITASPGLEERDRPVLLDQPVDQVQRLGCRAHSLDRKSVHWHS